MKTSKKKCSHLEHKEIDAILFCEECKLYLCNKCESYHSKLHLNHHTYKSEKDLNEIFSGFCKENKHHEELKFFCKNHNQLCCAIYIARIKTEDIGAHNECDVCLLDDIKDKKKNKIEENIRYLKDLSNTLQTSLKQLKLVFKKMNESKQEIKTKIKKVFTKLRNELNDREEKLYLETDEICKNIYCTEEIVKEGEE